MNIVEKKEWGEYLQEEDPAICKEIKLKTQRGLVVGEKEFIASLEKTLEISLSCLSPGRPKKFLKRALSP